VHGGIGRHQAVIRLRDRWKIFHKLRLMTGSAAARTGKVKVRVPILLLVGSLLPPTITALAETKVSAPIPWLRTRRHRPPQRHRPDANALRAPCPRLSNVEGDGGNGKSFRAYRDRRRLRSRVRLDGADVVIGDARKLATSSDKMLTRA